MAHGAGVVLSEKNGSGRIDERNLWFTLLQCRDFWGESHQIHGGFGDGQSMAWTMEDASCKVRRWAVRTFPYPHRRAALSMDGGLNVSHVGVLRPDVVEITVLDEMRFCVEDWNVFHATLEIESHEHVPFAIP